MHAQTALKMKPRDHFKKLEEEWELLVNDFLPFAGEKDSIWRYSRKMQPDDPTQGWKLHISAHINNAAAIFRACAPYLRSAGIMFKACATINILGRLNTGLFYGFSQIGKFITVYPPNAQTALRIAADIDALTAPFEAPPVPYDLPYRPGGCVYYRYGAFRTIEVQLANGEKGLAIRDPAGKFWSDRREPGHAVPAWLTNPFPTYAPTIDPSSPLCTQFLTYDALSQRGKGGVYLSIDIRATPPQRCVLKEGRHLGELSVDGRDGYALIAHEESVLRELRASNIAAPAVLAGFQIENHRYVVLEHIDGTSLMQLCSNPRRKLPLVQADLLAARTAQLVADIHQAGWVWRDCKPLNIMVLPDGSLRPIDFEGAVPLDTPSETIWGTPGYMPPEINQGPVTGSNLPEDLYALGATLHQIYSSFIPTLNEPGKESQAASRPSLGTLRKGVRAPIKALIAALLDTDPLNRPAAKQVADELSKYVPSEPIAITIPSIRRSTRQRPNQQQHQHLVEDIPGAERIILHDQQQMAEVTYEHI